MLSPRRWLRVLLVLAAVGLASAPAAATESAEHVDGFWLPGPGLILVVSGLVFAFGLFWVNVAVHVTVPWRRVERFGSSAVAAVAGTLAVFALGVVGHAEATMGVGWYLLPAVVATAAVGYASVAGNQRSTAAAVTTAVALFLAPAAIGWLFLVEGPVGVDPIRYPLVGVLALVAGCFTHAAGAVAATVQTRPT